MSNAVMDYVDQQEYDISDLMIEGHAMSQYLSKCFPSLSLLEVNERMRSNMQHVKKVKLNRKVRDQRESYVDQDDIVYITNNRRVITVFPNERIFVARPSVGRMGRKYL